MVTPFNYTTAMSPSNTIVSNTTLIPTAAITERSRTEQIRKYKEEMIESRAMEMWPCWHIMAGCGSSGCLPRRTISGMPLPFASCTTTWSIATRLLVLHTTYTRSLPQNMIEIGCPMKKIANLLIKIKLTGAMNRKFSMWMFVEAICHMKGKSNHILE